MSKTTYLVKKRLVVMLLIIGLAFVVMTSLLFYRQVIQAQWLQEKANSQWTSDLSIAAKRGRILDRNGNILAQSAGAKTIIVRPGAVENPETTADHLARILKMDRDYVYSKLTDKTKSEIWLKRQVEKDAEQEIRALELKGVFFTEDTKRYYPYSNLAAQVLGFVSVDGNGQSGIELYYNSKLSGTNGRIITETDKNGVELPYSVARYIDAKHGLDLVTTIDYVIQARAEEAAKQCMEEMNAESVICIAMDPKTAEILAMVNIPSFNLNDPPRSDMSQLNKLSYNSSILMSYEPGSTFKIITTAAALDSGAANVNSTYHCGGYKIVDGVRIKCWRTTPHGTQSLTQGVCNSCNPVFMTLAADMGTEKFYSYIRNFGFGKPTQIDFTGDASGIVTDEKYITDGDLARIGFGQSIAVTPLQLITAVSATINGGELMQPHLVKEFRTQGENSVTVERVEPTVLRRVISEQTSAQMRTILEEVVKNGGGKNAYIPGYRVGGKTGTAQFYDENGKVVKDKHISSFIGFAPADDPQIVVLFIVNKPDVAVDFGSVVAAPYAKLVLEDALKYMGVEAKYTQDELENDYVNVEVPDVTGMDFAQAVSLLEEQGFYVLTSGSGGEVAKQSPKGGTQVLKGTAVCLTATENAVTDEEVSVPNVLGMNADEAEKTLAQAGLSMIKIGNGTAAAYVTPQVGQKVAKGTVIIVEFH